MQDIKVEDYTQKQLVLRHLQTRGSITPLEALGTYSIYRLASIIQRLRKDGHDIITNIKRSVLNRPYASYELKK